MRAPEVRDTTGPRMSLLGSWSQWLVFAAAVSLAMLADRLLCSRTSERGTLREAVNRSVLWLGTGLGFAVWVAATRGVATGLDYLSAYLLEKSLSVDNLFVFLVIFRHFAVDGRRQRRALFWGVFGAILLRAAFIVLGTQLLSRFQWTFYLFGAFLVFSGLRLARGNEEAIDPARSVALRFAQRHLRTTPNFHGDRFFVRLGNATYATPLFLVLLVVEVSDLIFAVDSVPAVLGITVDLYVVYTSNIMAILGLRALYFLLYGMMDKFHKLDWALAAVLVFIGLKMIAFELVDLPQWLSLAVIAVFLGLGVFFSLILPPPLNASTSQTAPEARRDN